MRVRIARSSFKSPLRIILFPRDFGSPYPADDRGKLLAQPETVPCLIHTLQGISQLSHAAILYGQRQKEETRRWMLGNDARQCLVKFGSPQQGSSPLAKDDVGVAPTTVPSQNTI